MYCKLKYFGILFPIVCLFSFLAHGQDTDHIISGLVLEKGSSVRIADVNVQNLRSKQTVATSSYGVFTIEANVGDTLRLSKVGYGPVKTVLHTLEDVLIDMQSGTTLETIVITRQTKEAELNTYLKDFEKKGVYNGGHNKTMTYLASPATALYNLFGKDAKNAKRFERYMSQELEATKVDRVFNKTIVSKITNLEGEELQNFMELYRPSSASIARWGEYDLLNYISTSFKAWNEQGRPKPQRLPKLEIPPQQK